MLRDGAGGGCGEFLISEKFNEGGALFASARCCVSSHQAGSFPFALQFRKELLITLL